MSYHTIDILVVVKLVKFKFILVVVKFISIIIDNIGGINFSNWLIFNAKVKFTVYE